MTFSDITKEDFKYIVEEDENICAYSAQQISDALASYVSQFTYQNPLFEERSYNYVGVPDISYSPTDGIVSSTFSIGSNGIITIVNYSNKAPAVLSPDIFLRRLKHLELKRYKDKRLPTMTRPNSPEGNEMASV
jgi:hypothetical protein